MTKKLYVRTDITDWWEECRKAEVEIDSDDDVVALVVETGKPTGEVARHLIVLRQLGEAPKDILKPNKLLLYAGAREEVSKMVRDRKREVEMPNGSVYEVREYLATPVQQDDRDDGKFASTASPAGLDNAEHYLLDTMPGHIWCRLTELAAGGRDVEALSETLIAAIREMVTKLVNGGEEPGQR